MKSAIAEALSLHFSPLAIFYSPVPPEEGREAKGMCAMIPIAQAIKGETIYFSATSCSCPGATWGFGWTRLSADVFPGGRGCFERFLSIGNKHTPEGEQIIEQLEKKEITKLFIEEFREGEGFVKNEEFASEFADSMPIISPEEPYIVMKPIDKLIPSELPQLVSLTVNAQQLSALIVLANYARHGNDNVRIPFGSGCMTHVLYPYSESEQPNPHAIVGLTDISARMYVRKSLGSDYLSFTVPWSFYEEMESNVSESFLSRFVWKTLNNDHK